MAAFLSGLVIELRSGFSKKNKLEIIKNIVNCESRAEIDVSKRELVCEAVALLCDLARVPPLNPSHEHSVLSAKDFDGVADVAEIVFRCLHYILEAAEFKFKKEELSSVIILCFQYEQTSLWSHQSSVKRCNDVLNLTLRRCGVNDVSGYLLGEEENVLKKLFTAMIPQLNSASWKSNPAFKRAFQCCLFHVTHPYCADVLEMVLAPSLLFVDDFVVDNRIDGIRCLHHILNNTPVAELQRSGAAQLVYSALKNVIYQRDPAIVDVVYPALLSVLTITQPNPQKPEPIRRVNEYDVLLQHLLKEMNMEQTLALRVAFSKHLHLFVDVMGLTVVRHLKKMLNILLQYLEVFDGADEFSRINCLKCLKKVIKAAQPRIEGHLDAIVKALVRLLYQIHRNNSNQRAKDEVVSRCVSCLSLLHELFPSHVDALCRPLEDVTDEIPSLNVIGRVWQNDTKT